MSPILVAADVPSLEDLDRLISRVAGHVAGVKVGLELMHACGGPQVVEIIMDHGVEESFYDAKLCDIPTTMAGAMKAIARLGVTYTNVMASAGPAGIEAVVENCGDTRVLVVTVLTSLREEQCARIHGDSIATMVMDFALMAAEAGAHGLICSAKQLPVLRQVPELSDMLFVTPGVRSAGVETHDQKQVATPADAMRDGADRLVVGREITEAENPAAAADRINNDIAMAPAGASA